MNKQDHIEFAKDWAGKTMSEELKPCPFCGEQAEIYNPSPDHHEDVVVCSSCGAESGIGNCKQKWNRRVEEKIKWPECESCGDLIMESEEAVTVHSHFVEEASALIEDSYDLMLDYVVPVSNDPGFVPPDKVFIKELVLRLRDFLGVELEEESGDE